MQLVKLDHQLLPFKQETSLLLLNSRRGLGLLTARGATSLLNVVDLFNVLMQIYLSLLSILAS